MNRISVEVNSTGKSIFCGTFEIDRSRGRRLLLPRRPRSRIRSEAIDHRYSDSVILLCCLLRVTSVSYSPGGLFSGFLKTERMECGVINQRPVLKRIGLINALTSCTRAQLRNRACGFRIRLGVAEN